MVRGKDPFWQHVEVLENGRRFSCKFCKKKFRGGISRIKSHLSGVSGRDIKICGEVTEAIQLEAKQALLAIDTPPKRAKNVAIDTPAKRAKNVAPSNNVLEGESILGKRQDKSIVDQKLAKFLISEGISTTVVESPLLFDFVKGVAEYGPGYKLPYKFTIEGKLKQDIENEVKEYIQNVLDVLVETGCTLMYNGIFHGKKLMDIFAYTPIGVVCIATFAKPFENSLGFEKFMPSIMDLIGSTNVVQFLINNDIDEGILTEDKDMLRSKYPWIYQTRCPARGIKLLMRKIYDVPYVYTTIQVAEFIAIYIYHHDVNVSLRRVCKRDNDDITSCVLKLIAILEVESKLQALEVSIATLSSDWGMPHDSKKILKLCNGAKFIDYVIHCKEFWSRVKMVAQVMQPLIQANYLVDCDGPTSGYLYEIMQRVQDASEQFHDNNVFYDDICKILKEVRSDIIYPMHEVAAFLNPVYMCSEKFKENDEMKNGVNHVCEHLVAKDEREDFMNQVQLYCKKDLNVFTAQAIEMLKTCHPLVWWERCGNDIPILKKCAIRILSQPCSSSIFKRHHELCKKDTDDHTFMVNTIMMERCKSLQAQRTEPIIIDKLGEAGDVDDSNYSWHRPPYFPDWFINNITNDPTSSWINSSSTGIWIDRSFEAWDRFDDFIDELSFDDWSKESDESCEE